MKSIEYKILLIEDDKLDQMAFRRFVKDEKLTYNCIIAGSVSEAHGILGSERFDVIISDYTLGDGTASDILDLAKNTPVIVVTGTGDEEIVLNIWKAGAYDYLIKDLERNYLKAVPITIENAVEHNKMKEQVQLLSGAVMSTDDSVYITDLEDKIIFVNRAFCETYGYQEEDIVGKDSNILTKESFLNNDSMNIYRGSGSRELGSYHTRKDGSEFPVSLTRSVIKDENGNETALVAVARDISERIFVEDKIKNINLKLKKGIRQVG